MNDNPALPIFTLLLSTLLQGCFCSSYRQYATISVEDRGDGISTKYRYRIAAIDGALYSGNAIGTRDVTGTQGGDESVIGKLKVECPTVFSDAGIPIVVRSSVSGGTVRFGWTQVLAGLSGTLFPALYHDGKEYAVELVMVDDNLTRGKFMIEEATERTVGVFPTALIPFGGAPEHGRNRVYWRSGNTIGTEGSVQAARSDFYFSCPDFARQGFAYGIVAKLKEMEDSGAVDSMLKKLAGTRSKVPAHRIARFERDAGSDFTYAFAIELTENPRDMDNALTAVAQEFAEQVKGEYADTYPGTSRSSLVVDFANMKANGRMIEGRAVVLAIVPMALSYDANIRRGKMRVKFNGGQAEEARAWIHRNIKTLAHDKNILLTTGQLPPEATYYSLGEKVEGNVMEIEFKTE